METHFHILVTVTPESTHIINVCVHARASACAHTHEYLTTQMAGGDGRVNVLAEFPGQNIARL